jgi:hypothetical protein
MQTRRNIDDTASRANDQKRTQTPAGKRSEGPGDGKDEDTPQGGKRRGPGRWVDLEAASGD